MKVRREAAQTVMDARRATGGFRRRTRQYVGALSSARNPTERNAADMPVSVAVAEAS
jgi:hypothetical protein